MGVGHLRGEAVGDLGGRFPVKSCRREAFGMGEEYLSLTESGDAVSEKKKKIEK